jgi:hypothetical protein
MTLFAFKNATISSWPRSFAIFHAFRPEESLLFCHCAPFSINTCAGDEIRNGKNGKNVCKRVANQRKQDIERMNDKDLYCAKRSMLSSDMQRGLQSRHINHIDVRY